LEGFSNHRRSKVNHLTVILYKPAGVNCVRRGDFEEAPDLCSFINSPNLYVLFVVPLKEDDGGLGVDRFGLV